ncbi:hypothetical protein U1Q18_052774 [Sarracenia purpurea var. burkii]
MTNNQSQTRTSNEKQRTQVTSSEQIENQGKEIANTNREPEEKPKSRTQIENIKLAEKPVANQKPEMRGRTHREPNQEPIVIHELKSRTRITSREPRTEENQSRTHRENDDQNKSRRSEPVTSKPENHESNQQLARARTRVGATLE